MPKEHIEVRVSVLGVDEKKKRAEIKDLIERMVTIIGKRVIIAVKFATTGRLGARLHVKVDVSIFDYEDHGKTVCAFMGKIERAYGYDISLVIERA